MSREAIRIQRPNLANRAPAGADRVRFTLAAVAVSGNQVMTTDALAAAWSGMTGTTITLSEAFQIADRITAQYRQAGYILSQAVVPAQELSSTAPATLRIQVIEGYIGKLNVTGAAQDRIAGYLQPVLDEKPLRLATLERGLLLINEIAGVTVQSTLRAGAQAGASELDVVVDYARQAFSASTHNRVAKSQGPWRSDASASFRGVFGTFDSHDLRFITSFNQRTNLLAYSGEAPVGTNGLKIQWSGSSSKSKPLIGGAPTIDTQSDSLSLGATYPVLRSRVANLAVRGSLNAYNGRQDITSVYDRLRPVRVGVSADYADDFAGISLADVEVSKGLDAFGASSQGALSQGADAGFLKATLYVARLQSLGGPWSLLVAGSGQASHDKLASSEKFGLGGDVFLRAFDPSEVVGDSGLAGKVELRFNTQVSSVAGTVYAYYDVGRVTDRQVGSADVSTTLASAGLGLRVNGPRGTRGFLEAAKPYKKNVYSTGDRDLRLFAGVGINF